MFTRGQTSRFLWFSYGFLLQSPNFVVFSLIFPGETKPAPARGPPKSHWAWWAPEHPSRRCRRNPWRAFGKGLAPVKWEVNGGVMGMYKNESWIIGIWIEYGGILIVQHKGNVKASQWGEQWNIHPLLPRSSQQEIPKIMSQSFMSIPN